MPRLRQEYPGIGPWEWEAHPIWYGRVLCRLIAESEGAQIKRQNAEAAREEPVA